MKYTIVYAVDVPSYCEVEIEAESSDEAAEQARAMFYKQNAVVAWEPEPLLADNYRVVEVRDESGDIANDGFDLWFVPTRPGTPE